MSIRPLDMQIVMQRADQTIHAKQTVVNRNVNEQANVIQIHDKESERKLHTVLQSHESSKADYLKREKEHQQPKDSQQGFGSYTQEQAKETEQKCSDEDQNYNSQGKKTHFGLNFFDAKI